jgi:hypothetical protein
MTAAEPPIGWLLARFQADRLTQDWPAMRALLHPAARLESLAAPGFVLSADELIEAIREATAHGIYAVKAWNVELLTQHAALAVGRVRYSVGETGFTDEPHVWLASEQDGLIWRMRVFNERREVVDCLATEGLSLGL